MRLVASLIVALLCASRGSAAQPAPTLVVEAPPALAAARARVEGFDRAPLAAIVRLAGLEDPGPPMRVVLATDDSDWAWQVPSWVAGFAIGERSLIVLFPNRSPRYPHDTLEDVLRHEVAHVLVSRAARGREVPRGLNEGVAVVGERPLAFEDRARLATALLLGPRVTLDALDHLFTGDESSQARGYALAAAVVRDLMREHGDGAPARLLRELARGASFDEAVAITLFRSVRLLEAEFWARQRTWTMWVPIVASSSVLWLVVIGIAGLAVRRRRQRAAGDQGAMGGRRRGGARRTEDGSTEDGTRRTEEDDRRPTDETKTEA